MYKTSQVKKPGQDDDFQLKLTVFIIFTSVILVILLVRIGYLQIFKSEESDTYTKRNREKKVRTAPIRGSIFSSDGQILAHNKKSFNIFVEPQNLYKDPQLRQTELVYLSSILNIDYSALEKAINENNKVEEVQIAENITFTQFVKIKEYSDKLPGISAKETLIRSYPHRNTLAHVIGYIGPITRNEFSVLEEQGYKTTDIIGKTGVEQSYEDLLRGTEGQITYEVDARMNVINKIEDKSFAPLPGDEIVLSVDLEFQKNVEDILADRLGTILVMKPGSGEIVAMASYPDYDPNIYILNTAENAEKKLKILLDTKGTPLINRAIQTSYPPASTFKMVSSLILLNENIVTPYKKYYCGGKFKLNYETFKCWSVHNHQNLDEAIYNSCDIYFYNTSMKIGLDKIHDHAKMMGFGNVLGIDIPYEKKGIIPSKKWIKEERNEHWSLGYTLQAAIGQGFVQVTPLQIANYISIINNNGHSYKPHVVKEIRSSQSGEVKQVIKPEKIIDIDINPAAYEFVKKSMTKVVTMGTAQWAFNSNPVSFAGKTGTAEVGMGEKKQTHSLFAGFGPLDVPPEERIVVVVLIEYANEEYLKFAAAIASLVVNSYVHKENFEETAKKLYYPIQDSYYQ